ncbi:MAG: cupin domain-containing protein [Candidatus Latescibacteria bacterium]|nr:cupin domain-containing protein [Candidatus Latescibacterota bacterium]
MPTPARTTLISQDLTRSVRMKMELVVLGIGERTASERHAEEEICYVLTGRGMLVGDGEPVAVNQDCSVYMAPNLEHFLYNTGDSEFRYLSLMSTV